MVLLGEVRDDELALVVEAVVVLAVVALVVLAEDELDVEDELEPVVPFD